MIAVAADTAWRCFLIGSILVFIWLLWIEERRKKRDARAAKVLAWTRDRTGAR